MGWQTSLQGAWIWTWNFWSDGIKYTVYIYRGGGRRIRENPLDIEVEKRVIDKTELGYLADRGQDSPFAWCADISG